MKKGKILTNPLIRSVLRAPFPQREKEELVRDGAVLGRGSTTDAPLFGAGMSTTVYGREHAEALSFYRSLNSALAAGIEPESVLLFLTLPVSETETVLANRMRRFQNLAEGENLRISGGHTTFSENVRVPVLGTVISGKFAKKEACPQKLSGLDLVIAGTAGAAGASLYLEEHRKTLRERFTDAFLDGAKIREEELSVRKAAGILSEEGAIMHDISEGGAFSALYTFAEGLGTGFSVDLYAVPILQETIEICNFFDVNPYEMLSTGAILAAVRDGKSCVGKLTDAGIRSLRHAFRQLSDRFS